MSTEVIYFGEKSVDRMMMTIYDFAEASINRREDPTGEYHGNITIEKNRTPFNSYAEAEAYLEEAYPQNYCDGAVPYYVVPENLSAPTKTEETLKERARTNRLKKSEYDKKNSVLNQKSKLITCKKCESKIAKSYLHGNYCPVCHNDLRSEYIIERLNKFDTDYKKITNELKEREDARIKKEIKRNKKNAQIHWAAKASVRS